MLAKETEEQLLYRDMQSDMVQQIMRRLAAAQRAEARRAVGHVQLRAEQLDAQLSKTLAPRLPDPRRRAAARAGGGRRDPRRGAQAAAATSARCFIAERGFDWSELAQAGASQSLFGGRKIVELRIPSGKPGTQGARGDRSLLRQRLSPDNVTLVTMPRLRKARLAEVRAGSLRARRAPASIVDV